MQIGGKEHYLLPKATQLKKVITPDDLALVGEINNFLKPTIFKACP